MNNTKHTQMTIFFMSLLFSWTSHWGLAQDGDPLVRYPALSPDGSQIAFSYQGDIWTMTVNGKDARRLTIHEAYEGWPQWSPDGQSIAFSSNRFGNNDIYTIPAQGGKSKRLTFHSAGDAVESWLADGQILFSTRRVFRQVEREGEIHRIAATGGTPERYLNSFGAMPKMSPNQRFLVFVKGSCRIAREAYKGPANRNLWIYDTKNQTYSQLTDFEGQDIYPQWGDDQTIYYLSTSNGRYNIHRLKINAQGQAEGSPEALTKFTDYGLRSLDISKDGQMAIFSRGGDVYKMPTSGGAAQKIQIQFQSDDRYDPISHETFSNNIQDYALSPNGKLAALVIRGEIFVKKNDKENSQSVNLSKHAYRDQEVTWLNDSTLIFVSDRDGQRDLYLARSRDSEESSLFKSLKSEIIRLSNTPEDEADPKVSPDGKKIAFTRGQEMLIADIDAQGKMSQEKVMQEGWNVPGGVAWSPDSRWIAYGMTNLDFNSEVFIQPADASQPARNISMHPRRDGSPYWSADGSKLGFVSNRSGRDNADIWFVWLKKEDWEKTQQDWKEDEEETAPKKGKGKKGVTPIDIDFENIHERLVQVTALPGDEYGLSISQDGETFYFVSGNPTARGNDLYSIKWDGSESKQITRGGKNPGRVQMDKAGKYLYMVSRGRMSRLNAKSSKTESLPHRAKMTIDHAEERKQMFAEAWKLIDDNFYDPKFHGNDWNQLKAKYQSLAFRASTDRDFRDIFNDMLGELNASHMGLYGSDRAETQRESTGRLGIEVAVQKDGAKVLHVVPNTPADKSKSKIEEGDLITRVNGEAVTPGQNFYSLLTNTNNNRVLVNVKGKDGKEREVVIRPSSSINRQLYEEWVQERKRLTEEYSGGRLGYIHIQGMNWPSFERFERELTASGQGKDGIVIDVRYNGGGWTTDFLMSVLTVQQHAYTIPRGATDDLDKNHQAYKSNYPFGERLPWSSWTRPSIALCNTTSYSNAEIFSHAYKNLDIGTLVGEPTFGAVISTGGARLIDGSLIRQPFRAWYVKATEENMENGPAVPDIILSNAPDSKSKGQDEQLKRAVDELINQIDRQARK